MVHRTHDPESPPHLLFVEFAATVLVPIVLLLLVVSTFLIAKTINANFRAEQDKLTTN